MKLQPVYPLLTKIPSVRTGIFFESTVLNKKSSDVNNWFCVYVKRDQHEKLLQSLMHAGFNVNVDFWKFSSSLNTTRRPVDFRRETKWYDRFIG